MLDFITFFCVNYWDIEELGDRESFFEPAGKFKFYFA